MLTEKELNEELHDLWNSMTKEKWNFDIYFKQPTKGYGYKTGGEYYLYVNRNMYVLSYSERGDSYVIIESEDFNDIKFEIAWSMTFQIISSMMNKDKGLDWRTRMEIQLELFKRTDDMLYQKAKSKWEQQINNR